MNLPLTDGKQIPGGSCNPAPMGVIPSKDRMPASKFVFPKNGGTVPANQKFTIQMKIKNLETGNFVNAQQNYYSAPQQLNNQGFIKGHSHVVIQQMPAFDSTEILEPEVFAFFKGLNDAAIGEVLTADVTDGLPPGVYRLSSINTASNHQPVLTPIAQHGSLDDAVYVCHVVLSVGSASAHKSLVHCCLISCCWTLRKRNLDNRSIFEHAAL